MTKKEMERSSDSPPTSISSLPYDIILNCLARVSIFYRPTLSLVSKNFRSLISSPDLEATRSRIGITEEYLCVCFEPSSIYNSKLNQHWFAVSSIPKQKLKPIASFTTFQNSQFSTVVSSGSKIYMIGLGNFFKGTTSKRALVIDCQSNQCRRLPNMHHPRANPAVDVINGKIYVTGGCESSNNNKDWGEVYDPKTNTWEILLPTTQDVTVQKSDVPSNFNMLIGGKVYAINGVKLHNLLKNSCLVEIKNVLCLISVLYGNLVWRHDKKREYFGWDMVKGLEGISFTHLVSVAKSPGGRRRVTIWWTSASRESDHHGIKECKTEIWCAEISFERSNFELGELWGFVEWSKNVFTFDGYYWGSNMFLHSALVTH